MNIDGTQLRNEYQRALSQWSFIPDVEKAHGLPDRLLFAVGSRETNLQNMVGDNGHGFGVWQRDDRTWPVNASYLSDVHQQAEDAADLLSGLHDRWGELHGWLGVCAAYNSGQPIDSRTTGGDYGADVIERLNALGGPQALDDVRSVQQDLHTIGWPISVDGELGPQTETAVRAFQQAWPRCWDGSQWTDSGAQLTVDGIAGPMTTSALKECAGNGGLLSDHFAAREFACKHCNDIRVHRDLVSGLEVYRSKVEGRPVGIVSGYRCAVHNREVGGATNSQHLWGTAADVGYVLSTDDVRKLAVFAGIGYGPGFLVRHVDVRDAVGAVNTTGGTRQAPTVWQYAT